MPAPGRDRWLSEQWATAFARSVEDMTGQRTTFEVSAPSPDAAETADLVWRRQSFNFSSAGPFWIGASPATISDIGSLILHAAGIDDADADTISGTFYEMLGQALGTVVRVISATVGSEVKPADQDDSAPEADASPLVVRISIGDAPAITLRTAVSPRLSQAIEQAAAPRPDEPPAPPSAVQVANNPPPAAAPPQKPRPIDLLLDVELPVSVSFGRAQLLLRDVIKLTTGSIIELNRSISEPVDVIVNNCVIARGEVVVVEGNFGVRIHQVVSRQERLRTLR
ncbi:MAG TPA: flagellar motor switch protein FliN [Bryobacteraceae bacterium]|nr:flagellar motor switch protein FliN [Bryobacteraceae bacterium]